LFFLLFEEKSSAPERKHPALNNVIFFIGVGGRSVAFLYPGLNPSRPKLTGIKSRHEFTTVPKSGLRIGFNEDPDPDPGF
jgi:hypothetical protein